MSNLNMYYTPENMQDKKLSDLSKNKEFLTDAYTFLMSERKGWTEEELSTWSNEDVVDEVLEHFRVQSTNEVTMAKDYYYIDDEMVAENEKQSYGRLLFAFDNAKGEGMFDRGGAKVFDYAEGVLTAPSTALSVGAGILTAGTGTAAVQTSKLAAQQAIRKVANKTLGRAALAAGIDGSLGAGASLGVESIKSKAGKPIGEDYDINYGSVALSGVASGLIGGTGYALSSKLQQRGGDRLVDQLDMGRQQKALRIKDAELLAANTLKSVKKGSPENKRLAKFTTDKLLHSIDPTLVKEGGRLKVDLLSDKLPEGLVASFDKKTMHRLGAAAYELASKLGVKAEKGERVTEYLARSIAEGKGDGLFKEIAEKYALTPKQLSAVYAAEVSDAAKTLVMQKNLKNNAGFSVNSLDAKKFKEKMESLYETGMTGILTEQQIKEMDLATINLDKLGSKAWRRFKDIESARRAFMTSQPATTMRNNIFGVAMTGIDVLDQLNLSVVKALRGKDASIQTFKGALDNLNYLTKDNYIAETAMTMLTEISPEKMGKVFYDAATAEQAYVGNTLLSKAGKYANTLNTISDHIFKKAVVAGTIDRELKKLGNKELGTSLYDMLGKGNLDILPDDILNKALDESLAFTFQRRLPNMYDKKASQAAKNASWLVDGITKSGATILFPFPRYIASQAKFISDYSGLTLLRRGVFGSPTGQIEDEAFAKLATGAVMFGGLYAAQKDNIAKMREWYMAEDSQGNVYNAQAALGPAALHAWAANLAARAMDDDAPMKDTSVLLKEAQALVIGTEFRPSTGIGTKIIEFVETDNPDPLLNLIGDYFASYTYPLSVVKDAYSQFDTQSSYRPETRDGTVSLIDTSFSPTGSIALSTMQRFTRFLPDVDDGSPIMQSLGKLFSTSTKLTFQTMYNKGPDNTENGYDPIRFDVFGKGPLRIRNPILKQLTGFEGTAPNNKLKKEITRLQLDPFKLYNPYTERNTPVTLLTEQLLQGNLAAEMELYIDTDTNYTNATTEEQRVFLNDKIKETVTNTREYAREQLEAMSKDKDFSDDYFAYVRGKYRAMPKSEKTKADIGFSYLKDSYGYTDIGDDFESIRRYIRDEYSNNPDQRDTMEALLIEQYISAGKASATIFKELKK